jgi:hypothetical protein
MFETARPRLAVFASRVFQVHFGTFRRSEPFTTGLHEEKATLSAETLPYIGRCMEQGPERNVRLLRLD